MLSNPTTNLQKRQRQHRRQQSTPVFEAPKVPILPTLQRHASHRRGISLDQRPRRQSPTQDTNRFVTNYGFHILQETQPQILRPGPALQAHLNMTNDENYIISPLVTPHRQEFDIGCGSMYGGLHEPASPYSPYCDQIDTAIRVHPNDMSPSYQFGVHDSTFPNSGTVSPSPYVDFSMGFDLASSQDDWSNTIKPTSRRPVTRRISGGIASRVARFEDMASEPPNLRPITPPTQNVTNYFPPTPSRTPYNAALHIESIPQRFQDDYDTSMEATIKPSHHRNNQRANTIFQDLREHAQMHRPLSPPGSGSIPASSTFDSARMPPAHFMDMPNISLDFMQNNGGYNSSNYSPATSNISPELSQPSSPEVSKKALPNDAFDNSQNLESSTYLPTSTSTVDDCQPMSPPDSSQLARSTSVDSFNLDETITDTGITVDDIACYIDGPDPKDQKWLCLYPECKKRFGRKENIKSHVQTHLGDRQYQCPHCQKCFVRQHDLKRHAKIHSGVKPYPCACGNSFARHDALTRHRQRGMCIGAFEGVVKKVVKRGRPRKHRPDNEERLDKSSRTRNKNKAMSSSSSVSNDSDSSYGLSPPADFNVLDDTPFGDFNSFAQNSTTMAGGSFSYSPPRAMTDYVSPQATQNAHSPSAFSNHSHHSHHSQRSHHHRHRSSVASIASQHLPSHPASPAKSHASLGQPYSRYNTPPELCLSSSSPPSSTKFYDIPEHEAIMGLGKIDELHAVNDDQMFLDAFADSSMMGMTRLEQDPDLLLMGGKFDDAFTVVDDNELFGASTSDVFFGSP